MKSPLRFKSTSSYQFKRKLGSGGSADALLFSRHTDSMPPQDVVIKTLHSGAETITELVDEGRKLASLRHPHILSTFGYEKLDKDEYGLILEYVPGDTLKNIISVLRPQIRPQVAASIIKTMAEALVAAHEQNIVHGDVSARNVLVSDQGHLKLADFGLARRISDQSKFKTYGRGSVDYLAPERWLGEAPSFASDAFALGILAYEIIEGVNPLQGRTLTEAKLRLEQFLKLKPWSANQNWLEFFDFAFAPEPAMRSSVKSLSKKIPAVAIDTGEIQMELARSVNEIGDRETPSFSQRTVTALFATKTAQLIKKSPVRWALSPLLALLSFGLMTINPGATGNDHDLPGHLRQSTLTITSQPWGEVVIDGVSLGYTPVVNVPVRSGFHSFVWKSQDKTQVRRTLQTYDNGSIAYQIIKIKGQPLKIAPIKPRLTRPI